MLKTGLSILVFLSSIHAYAIDREEALKKATEYCEKNYSSFASNSSQCKKGAHIGIAFEGSNPPLDILSQCKYVHLQQYGTPHVHNGEIVMLMQNACADGAAYGVALVRGN